MLIVETKVRKCGKKKPGSFYVVGGEPVGEEGSSPVFTLLNPPIPYDVGVHRGARLVDDQAVLQRLPMEDWWYGASKETEIQKSGDEYWKTLFGMPLHKRLGRGVLAEVTKAEEGLTVLAGTVSYNHDLVRWYRQLTIDDVQNLPGAAIHCDAIRNNLAEFTQSNQVGYLVKTQAHIWMLAEAVPVSKRKVVLPTLIRMLMLLGLRDDTALMARRFPLGV